MDSNLVPVTYVFGQVKRNLIGIKNISTLNLLSGLYILYFQNSYKGSNSHFQILDMTKN